MPVTRTNQRKDVKSYPHLNVYFYLNRGLNIETIQHLCSIHHMPVYIPSLLCVLTHLSSQHPSDIYATVTPTYRWRVRQKTLQSLTMLLQSKALKVRQAGLRIPHLKHQQWSEPHSQVCGPSLLGWARRQNSSGWVSIYQTGSAEKGHMDLWV